MKKNLLLLAFTIFFGAANAQDVLSFDVTPVIEEGITSADTDVPGKSFVNTTSTTEKTYKWTLENLEIAEGWTSAVCDRNNCYFPHVLEKEITLSATNNSNIDVHVYPNGNEGCATIKVTVEDVNDPSISVENMFHFNPGMNGCAEVSTSTDDEKAAISKIQLYPNPVQNTFKVGEYEQIKTVEVYNQLGQQVKSFLYVAGQSYDVAELAKGNYIVRIANKEGATIVSRLMHKM